MKLLHRVFASVAAMIALGSSAQARAPQARPALWSVSDADTTVYLFGTIHLLPDNYQWRTPKLDQAVGGSQQLVIETIVDDGFIGLARIAAPRERRARSHRTRIH